MGEPGAHPGPPSAARSRTDLVVDATEIGHERRRRQLTGRGGGETVAAEFASPVAGHHPEHGGDQQPAGDRGDHAALDEPGHACHGQRADQAVVAGDMSGLVGDDEPDELRVGPSQGRVEHDDAGTAGAVGASRPARAEAAARHTDDSELPHSDRGQRLAQVSGRNMLDIGPGEPSPDPQPQSDPPRDEHGHRHKENEHRADAPHPWPGAGHDQHNRDPVKRPHDQDPQPTVQPAGQPHGPGEVGERESLGHHGVSD
jgi:hypothetical protein